jgi:predicted RNA-binding Zn ribbon-like protein
MTQWHANEYQGKAGRVCLDFANTVEWHASDSPQDTLHSFADLADWAHKVGLLTKPETQGLLRGAEANPAQAERVLRRAIQLREAVYRIFVSLSKGKKPADLDMDELNKSLSTICDGARIRQSVRGFEWEWNVDRNSPDFPVAMVALSAAELLVSEDRERVGQCADERGCGWLFLDTSKNHSRRWCDSKDCGNRERQHRYYERTRGQA